MEKSIMAETQFNFRANEDILTKATAIFATHNLDLSKALNLFLERTVEENAIPFDIYQEQEMERIFQDLKAEVQKGYDSYRRDEKLTTQEMRAYLGI
jgi:addiction module RelB/DinJ family antitoxin